ncbi:MAG: lysine biosynthesis protein LysW [Acidobacteriota bacterium]|nr:lysine biosynthesis protein LysW [Acidobacteriota bacterium]
MGTCLECEETFDINEDMEIYQVVVCPNCHTRLEILDMDPVVVDYAEEEED